VQLCADQAAQDCDMHYQAAAAAFPTTWRTVDELFVALGRFSLQVRNSPTLTLSAEMVEYAVRKEAEWLLSQLTARGNHYEIWDDVRSGFNGGLRGVLSAAFVVCRSLCVESAQLTPVTKFFYVYDQLSCEEQMTVADLYWERFGSLYPVSSLAKHREWRAMRFRQLIQNHWTLVTPLREALRC
jgi:hypothetical protein